MRPSGRAADVLRPISLTPGFARHAEGSCLIRMGNTEVLCAASVEGRVPPFLRNSGQGWVTAEYGMLPRATHTRGEREAARGKQSGRTQEIQRLIGRALRAVVDRSQMGEVTVTLDCDVLNADGGTRCAAITGAWVALSLAFRHMQQMNVIKTLPLIGQVAAVSCGIIRRRAGAGPGLRRGLLGRRGRQLRADRQRRHRRDPGHGGTQRVQRGAVPRHAGPRAPRRRGAVRGAARGRRRGVMARRLAGGTRLVLASHNPGKLAELADLLRPHASTVVSAGALGLPEPPEDAPDFVGNARIKALAAARASGLPALADDSGFCVAALDGAPGVLFGALGGSRERILPRRWRGCTARWLTPPIAAPGSSPRCASPGRTATPRPSSAASMAQPIWPPRGDKGFGYDPMFLPAGGDATFGEMDPAEKHAVSHRARARSPSSGRLPGVTLRRAPAPPPPSPR